MRRINRLSESDLSRIVRRVIKENEEESDDTRYGTPPTDDDMAPIGKTYGEIRSSAPKVNAELVRSGQGNETDAEFLNDLMKIFAKYNIRGFKKLEQKAKNLTDQGFMLNVDVPEYRGKR